MDRRIAGWSFRTVSLILNGFVRANAMASAAKTSATSFRPYHLMPGVTALETSSRHEASPERAKQRPEWDNKTSIERSGLSPRELKARKTISRPAARVAIAARESHGRIDQKWSSPRNHRLTSNNVLVNRQTRAGPIRKTLQEVG